MQWSKVRQQVGSRLAPSVAERVDFHCAGYRWHHDADGRLWITVDKEEVASFCTLTHWNEKIRMTRELLEDDRDPRDASAEAEKTLNDWGLLTRWRARQDLEDYLDMTVEQALVSESPLHLALALLDRRFGKRRLATFSLPEGLPAFVSRLHELRLEGEGIEIS